MAYVERYTCLFLFVCWSYLAKFGMIKSTRMLSNSGQSLCSSLSSLSGMKVFSNFHIILHEMLITDIFQESKNVNSYNADRNVLSCNFRHYWNSTFASTLKFCGGTLFSKGKSKSTNCDIFARISRMAASLDSTRRSWSMQFSIKLLPISRTTEGQRVVLQTYERCSWRYITTNILTL